MSHLKLGENDASFLDNKDIKNSQDVINCDESYSFYKTLQLIKSEINNKL